LLFLFLDLPRKELPLTMRSSYPALVALLALVATSLCIPAAEASGVADRTSRRTQPVHTQTG